MNTPTNDPKTWEYYVSWGTPFRRPIIYLTFPTFEAAKRIGHAIMKAAERSCTGPFD